MIRIWLNHWFSTAYNIVNLIKQDDPDFYVIGTNENYDSPIRTVCDEWYQESTLKDDEYVNIVWSFVKRIMWMCFSRDVECWKEAGKSLDLKRWAQRLWPMTITSFPH